MDLKIVKKFITLAKKEGVKSLSYQEGDSKISVELEHGEIVQRTTQASANSSAIVLGNSGASSQEVQRTVKDENVYEVTAPFVGTFYASPGPEESVFTSVGAKVIKGQTVCILEAMKIMNEIESEFSGEVIEVCIDNEDFVEFGQVLFRIKKS